MPAKRKLTPAQKKLAAADENKYYNWMLDLTFKNRPEKVVVSSNGTKINGDFMVKPDGTKYVREIIKVSRKKSIMKWRQI